jgi:hypothetical protein
MMESDDQKGRPGRKPALTADDKTFTIVEGLARIQCTQAEAGAVLGVTRETFYQFLKAHPDAREVWDLGLESGKASLRRNQFKLSATNAAMSIWLGKQYLNQRDVAADRPELPLGKKETAALEAETAGFGTDWGDDLNVECNRTLS